jgi:hypothetical protein
MSSHTPPVTLRFAKKIAKSSKKEHQGEVVRHYRIVLAPPASPKKPKVHGERKPSR